MPDVTIPADVAKAIARWMREEVGPTPSGYHKDWPDLLDPRPPSLREQVIAVLARSDIDGAHHPSDADAVLAVVAAAVAAIPAVDWDGGDRDIPLIRRDDAVALIRGGASS